MQLNNKTAIALLVVIELLVEFIADSVERTLSSLPWMQWYAHAQQYQIPDVLICYTMIAIMITAIAMLEPKAIDDAILSIWKLTKKYWLKLRFKRKRETTL